MKRLLSIIIAMFMMLTMVACGNNIDTDSSNIMDNITSSTNEDTNNQSSAALEKYQAGDIVLLEKYYESGYSTDKKNAEKIKSLQGNISQLQSGGTFPIFLTGNSVYTENFGILTEMFKLNENPDSILYFDNIEVGESIFSFKEGKLYAYNNDKGTLDYKNISFDKNKNSVLAYGWTSSIDILEERNGLYFVKHYSKEDEYSELKFKKEYQINEYELSNYDNIDIKELISLKDTVDAYSTYAKTENNDLYEVVTYSKNTCRMSTNKPIATNVDKILASSSVVMSKIAGPVYAKVEDDSKVYTISIGESLTQSNDNFEVCFNIPDEHKASEITEIIGVSEVPVFIFSNGDVYMSEYGIDKTRTEYSLIKIEDISKLNSEGKIKDFAGSSVWDNKLYMLQNDNKIYIKEIY